MASKKSPPSTISRVLPYVVSAGLGGLLTWAVVRPGGVRPEPASAAPAGRLDPARSPPDAYRWTELPEAAFPIPPYARFLRDVVIVLDPGHVGQSEKNRPDGWKRGPTGLREAEANLRVALYLREFLEAAGARVTLTREQDEPRDIRDEDDLAERAEIANRLRADALISIHHNAADRPEPNYTAVFYHADGGSIPASLCLGRELLGGINDALRLEKHVECGLWSDWTMYPSGFGLLRRLEVPGVLCESSFHTNPAEEQRLRDPSYNRREAYGMFLGLARWAQAGLPRVALLDPADGVVRRGQTVTLQLDDGLSRRDGKGVRAAKLRPGSVVVEWDGRRAAYVLNAAKGILQVTLPDSPAADATPASQAPGGAADRASGAGMDATLVAYPPPRPAPKSTKSTKAARPKASPAAPRGDAGGRRPPGANNARLFVDFENVFGQHVLHPWIALDRE